FSSSATAERAVIRLGGTDHTTFNNLTIDAVGAGTYGWGVWLLNGADSNAFNNCNILSSTTSTSTTNFAGVVITGSTTTPNSATASNCDGNIFNGNTITGGYYGMTMMSSAAAPIRNNKFINNQVRDFYSYGIYVGNTIDGLVEKNVISRPTRISITIFYGIYGGGTTNINLNVSKNRITNPAGGATTSTSQLNGIYFVADGGAGQEAKVTNNIIDNFDGAGALYGLYNSSANNVHYYHNTVSFDNTTSTSTNLSRGFYQTGTASGIVFKNNIVSITRGGTGARHAIYFATTGSTITSNKNDLYVSPATGTSGVGFYSTNQVTLANWQTASSQDANSQSMDPQFINITTGDFTPQQALIDDKGEPVGITTDFLNAARSLTTPDEGAIEFAIVPCTVPPVAGTSTVDPAAGICLGTFVTLNLSGNSTGGFQKYIWQYGPTAAGPWQDISDTLYSPKFQYELSSYTNKFFRAIVICGTGTSFSVPVQVSINPALLAGDYTIDPALPASATNFQSFATAVAAMQCGIAGSVRFHAVPGIYNEQILIKKVPGTSATSTVTFMSQNGNPASVNLTYNSTLTALNYVLKLDSASFITFKNITFTATNVANGRAIEFANNASKDSILNSVIDVPASSSTTNAVAGIFGTALTGTDIVIKGNTITDGSSNIYLSGTAGAANRFVVDSNILSGAYYYSSYTGGINNVRVTRNTVTRSGILNTTAYGIYLTNCDSVYVVDDNKVTIENAGTTNYAIYLTGCAAHPLNPGSVSRNKITAVNNVTSATLYGLYQSGSVSNYTVNNIIDVNSTGATVRGLYSSTGGGMKYYNNTVRNSSPSTAMTNVAAYFSQTAGTSGITNIQNNIFYHAGGGAALYQGNVANIYSDYNMYFTNGA
ncbi:MAG TPA: right-handed parallel beta-helix repeat-containing protein, partial [Flavitalea sp.]|nr:right-handed parallel beta-helix repeat-containing protein [Flavitalea sp.]